MAKERRQNGPAVPLPYFSPIYPGSGSWNTSSHEYTVPADGTYFFHMAAGAAAGWKVDLDFSGLPQKNGIFRNSVAHTGRDTMSRDLLLDLASEDLLYVAMGNDSVVHSDSMRQTVIAGFSLGEFMDQVLAFSASTAYVFTEAGFNVPFDNVQLNTGDGYSVAGREFTAPVNGIYYFSLAIGVSAGIPMRAQFVLNGEGVSELWRASLVHDGTDSLSKALLVQLSAGDTVGVRLETGRVLYDPSYPHISTFSGFLYSPAFAEPKAWCVHSNVSQITQESPLDPLPYNVISLNEDDLYNPENHTVTIPTTGLYFIHFSGGMQGYISGESSLSARLVPEGSPMGVAVDLYRSVNYNDQPDTLSRGLLVELEAGTSIRMVLQHYSTIYSDSDLQTSFLGFLLAETDIYPH